MEKKTKHRILGFLVVVALTVILLPLFQSANEPPSDTKLVKAPPFPDQSVQVATTTPVDASPEPTIIPVKPPQEAENTIDQQQPQDMMRVIRPSVVSDVANDTDTTVTKTTATKIADTEPAPNLGSEDDDDFHASQPIQKTTVSETPVEKSKPMKVAHAAVKKSLPLTKLASVSKTEHLNKAPITNNGLVELKNAVWVIQIGSFKNKANALRVVNQLRANGYRAFIQQISTAFGDNTRVFVGPEQKRNSARQLAERLENHMHIRGIVISYKPLAL